MKAAVRCSLVVLFGFVGILTTASQALAQPEPTASAPSEVPPATNEPTQLPTPLPPPPAPAPLLAMPPAPAQPEVLVPQQTATAGLSSLKIETPNSSIKFGLLAQPQYQSLGAGVGSGNSQNLYLRRIRLLVGGTLFNDLEYFVDTDSPNLLKTNAEGVRNTSTMVIQDAFATYKIFKDMVKVDAGYMLPALAHNALQGATTLYGLDYFANSFLHSNIFGNATDPIGRDFGVQLRGLVLDGLIEYRVGIFQGKRNAAVTEPPATAGGPAGPVIDVAGRNFFRVAGRVQINLLDPETGFFYSGTYLGAKKIFSIGGAYDFQYEKPDSYKYWAADAILDLPLGPGAVTAQGNLAQWNGGSLVNFTKRTAVMGEAGYRIADLKLSPIGRFEKRWLNGTGGNPDTTDTRVGGGLAFWQHGHNSNLKAFYTRIQPSAAGNHDYNQVDIQWQVFFF